MHYWIKFILQNLLIFYCRGSQKTVSPYNTNIGLFLVVSSIPELRLLMLPLAYIGVVVVKDASEGNHSFQLDKYIF